MIYSIGRGEMVTYVVEMRKLHNNRGSERGRGGFDCHGQDLGIEHSAIPGGTQSQVSILQWFNQTEAGSYGDNGHLKLLFITSHGYPVSLNQLIHINSDNFIQILEYKFDLSCLLHSLHSTSKFWLKVYKKT